MATSTDVTCRPLSTVHSIIHRDPPRPTSLTASRSIERLNPEEQRLSLCFFLEEMNVDAVSGVTHERMDQQRSKRAAAVLRSVGVEPPYCLEWFADLRKLWSTLSVEQQTQLTTRAMCVEPAEPAEQVAHIRVKRKRAIVVEKVEDRSVRQRQVIDLASPSSGQQQLTTEQLLHLHSNALISVVHNEHRQLREERVEFEREKEVLRKEKEGLSSMLAIEREAIHRYAHEQVMHYQGRIRHLEARRRELEVNVQCLTARMLPVASCPPSLPSVPEHPTGGGVVELDA